MKFKSKKQKVLTLVLGVALVCGLAVGVMYATGVLPGQTQGAAKLKCDCHTWQESGGSLGGGTEVCGKCGDCCQNIGIPLPA